MAYASSKAYARSKGLFAAWEARLKQKSNVRKSRIVSLRRTLSERWRVRVCRRRTDYSKTQATFWRSTSHRQQPERHRRGLEYPHQRLGRHSQGLQNPPQGSRPHHQRLENYRNKLEYYRKEPHNRFHPSTYLLLCPGTNLLDRLGSHQIHHITGPPARDPTQAWNMQHSRQREHRGREPWPRIWCSRTPIGAHLMSRRKKLGNQSHQQNA